MNLSESMGIAMGAAKGTDTSTDGDSADTTTASSETVDAETEAQTSYIYIADYFTDYPPSLVPDDVGFSFQSSTTLSLSKASATSTSYTVGLDLLESAGCITIADDSTYTTAAGEDSTAFKSLIGGFNTTATEGDLSHTFSTVGFGLSFEFDAAEDSQYPIVYDEAELSGLRKRYGYMTQDRIQDYLDEGIKSLTQNIIATLYENKYTFKKVKSPDIKRERLFTLAETDDQGVSIKTSTMERGVTMSIGTGTY